MKKIGVLGTGTMGAGIIQVLAQNGYEVVIRARREASIEKGLATVNKNLSKMVAKEKITEEEKEAILSRISGSTDINVVADADLIIEAATEDLEAKKALFAELDQLCKPETILATNRADKVIGMHFFNPVPAMKLVEIIKGLATSEETKDVIVELTAALGKTAVEVEEAPGFVVNRILIPMINEAVSILADGVADVEGIDNAMKLGANHPMGPLALGDLIGLDVVLAIMDVLHAGYGDKYKAHVLLRKMVNAGKLGRKTGAGFYDYTK